MDIVTINLVQGFVSGLTVATPFYMVTKYRVGRLERDNLEIKDLLKDLIKSIPTKEMCAVLREGCGIRINNIEHAIGEVLKRR